MRRFFLFFFILSFQIASAAVGSNYYFNQLSLEDGLSQSTVKAIYRDASGMLWIGTKEGLNLYDGEGIKTYYHDKQKENSLPNDDVFLITEDACNNLWIGTGGALCRYDRHRDIFIAESINGREVSLRSALTVGDISYFFGSNTLFAYDCKTGQWSEKIFHGDETQLTLNVMAEKWKENVILIGSRWRGLFECNTQTGELKKIKNFQYILDVFVDSKGYLWVSEYEKGVFCLDKNLKTIHDFSSPANRPYSDKVMNITEYEGDIWLSTDGNGILKYSARTGKFTHILNEPENPFSLPVNSILTSFSDSYSNLWLGTIRGGLLSVKKSFIHFYSNSSFKSTSGLSIPTVLSFYEDSDKNIWIGTDGEGMSLYNPASQKFKHFSQTRGKKISAITDFSNDHLLISVYKEGLMLFDKNSGKTTPLSLKDKDNKAVALNTLIGSGVINGGNDHIYISDDNVYSYSLKDKSISMIKRMVSGEGAIKMHTPQSLPGNILLYSDKIIYKLNITNNDIDTVFNISGQGQNIINAVDVDESGTFWVGTENGLYYLDNATKQLTQHGSKRIKTVSALVADNQGSLWIASRLQLLRYLIEEKEFIHYGKAEGVLANEYLPKSRLLGQNGDVYLGGVSGFVRIKQETPIPEEEIPAFELLDIQLDGSPLPYEKITMKNGLKRIKLPWDHTSLIVNLFINTKDLSRKGQYRYFLSGLTNSYEEIHTQSIRLSNLPAGNYTLKVEYELANEQWSDSISLLTIKVLPPWWSTWWFISILFVLAVFTILRLRTVAINKTRRAMEMEMQRHERDLSEQKVRFLINISHELRTPLTLVYSPLRRILNEQNVSESLRMQLSLMYKNVKNIKSTIDTVLDVRKMEKSPSVFNLSEQDINLWIHEVAKDFRLELSVKNLGISLDLDEEAGLLNIDAEKCERVLSNLLMNAIKFSEPDSEIKITSKAIDKGIYIAVSDEGSGVSAEDEEHLFTRFYQGTHQKGGTGIGLSYAKTLVEQHGGEIGYKRNTPAGSVFWFTLPHTLNKSVANSTFAQIIGEEREEPSRLTLDYDAEHFKQLSVLVVEDEKDLLNYIKESLQPYFKKVLCAADGEDALEKTHSFQPDMVVSDVMMPKMDGFELCYSIKTNVEISHIPVILLTALGDNESKLAGYKVGADMYLSKPFGIDMLLSIMSNILTSRNEIKKRYSEFGQASITPQELTFSNADETFLSGFTTLIDEKMGTTDINIDELASEMAMSRATFYSKVKSVTGMSVNNFITNRKINRAVELLNNEALTICDIAHEVGYSNQRYFSTVFKQVTGKTPTQYRQNLIVDCEESE